MTVLYLDIDTGGTIFVGDTLITVQKKTGRKTRLKIEADKSVLVGQAGGHKAQVKTESSRGLKAEVRKWQEQ